MTYKVQVIAVTTLLLWQILLSYGQNEPVKMTFLGVKPFESENTNTHYQCHISEPNNIAETANVESFRTVRTRNTDVENKDPPAPAWNAGGAYKHWRVTLDNNRNNDAFGVFGCEAALNGKITTSISGIFMRSDADIVPSDELVSLTVNAGDTDVSIGMKSTGSSNVADFRWLKDDVRKSAFNGDDSLVISGPVEVDDAGVYECHIQGQRINATQGLKLLIVRACPAQRWGPYACHGICDNCYNGGICDENSGKCICAPGFKGANCEEGCGGNRYGDTCEKQCSSTDASEKCACDPGTYGASCLQTCGNCQSDACDRYTGSCTGSSSCEVGWTGNSCQECEGARFGKKCAEDCHCSKEYCNQVTGECSEHCNSEWVELYPPNLCQIGIIDAAYTRKNPGVTVPVTCIAAKGPNPSDIINLNFVLSRHHENLDDNGISGEEFFGNATTRTAPFIVDDVTDGQTLYCQLRKDGKKYAVYNITIDVFDLPVLKSVPKKGSITNSTVTISWSAWDEENEDGDPPVIGYTPYYKLESEQDWSIQDTSTSIKALNFTFTALTPDERYSFSVAAVREGEMGEGPKSPMLNATTICAVPLSGPREVQATVTGESQENVEITWQVPSDEQVNCGSGVSIFTIYYSSKEVEPNDEGTKNIQEPDATSHIFENLMVGKAYTFQMTLTTAGGDSPFSDEVTHLLPILPALSSAPELGASSCDRVNITWRRWKEGLDVGTPPICGYIPYHKLTANLSWTANEMVPHQGENLWFEFVNLTEVSNYMFAIAVVREGLEGKGDLGTNLFHETPPCETGPSAGFIVGSTIGALLLIVLLVLLVIYLWRKSKSDKGMNDSQAARTKFGTSSSAFKPDVEPVTVITEADEDDLYINIEKPVPILVTNLETYMKNCEESKSNTLEQQFQGFNKGKQFDSEVGEEDDNRQKNRFKNMIAYDHSRVILEKLEGDPHSDYYNANYIKNAEEFNAFIACQGPNTASIDDFWRMVIQEKVLNIVMLTNLIEKGKERCKQYWPKAVGDTKKFATCEVKWESTENFADYEIRSLTVTFGNEQRKVRNWHYRTWPDMDVPQQATPLIGFAKKVKLQQSASTGPLVVHCSAGVGRTGTFIALSTLMDTIHNKDRIDIYGFVEKMRENRIMMVQTALQFKFLHTCLLEVYLTGETEITLGNISSFDADEKLQQLDKEFKLLSKLDKMSKTAHKATKEQAQKCRFPTMIPVEKRSPILQCMSKFGSNNFINACFASSFVMKDAFIATQSPLPNTTEDFWRLVYDWKCPLIAMLNQLDPKDESCCQYWPDSGSAEYGYLMVELKDEQDMGFYEYRVFELTHSYDKKNFTIHHLMLKAWNEGSDVLQLMKQIEILEEKYNLEGPKVVHCRNGVGHTGVLLAVKSEMERITVENKLNVFNSVRMLRSSNHSLVLTKEDYILCHQLLKMANPAEPEYANI
ncbi:receptor-type tyrosine-protein phosphatase F-like isoform X2 [Apostichopus japonicus]|uniref:receptor-type tyrosine-protein phosphatase F-like isoform X2 n=1 Tax=Stichopus japonicus TaxID=307972 RepID=UPI003AB6678F